MYERVPRPPITSAEWVSAGANSTALPALHAAIDAVEMLSPLATPAPTSVQIDRVLSFLESHRPAPDDERASPRERRAREAIVGTLEGLASASRAHDDPPLDGTALPWLVRRWIEEQTFAFGAEAGTAGLHLLDDQAARYGDFNAITIVGLIDGEWPERPQRNIFYSSSLLNALGWPSEKDWRSAAEARFLDLLLSPAESVSLSTITLDDEALVEVSTLLDQLPQAGLSAVEVETPLSDQRFPDEALSFEPPALELLDVGESFKLGQRCGKFLYF